MKFARWLPVAALLVVSLALAAVKLDKLLPKSNEISGWAVVAGTLRTAYGIKALYGLYDGDVDALKKFGIKAGAQCMYKNGSKQTMLDIMQVDSEPHAKALFKSRTRGIKSTKAILREGGGGMMATANGVTFVYMWQGPFFCNVNVYGASTMDKLTAMKFAKNLSDHISKVTK